MKSVLISIQPYWVFLIVAKSMGWDARKEKKVEVRKNFPRNENWSKVAKIYCTKNKNSFSKIPKEYQPLMKKFLGKIIGEFVCDAVISHCEMANADIAEQQGCIKREELLEYAGDKELYGWHISHLIIYDKPKELSEFFKRCDEGCEDCDFWKSVRVNADKYDMDCSSPLYGHIPITRPPQSWCYVEANPTEKGGGE
ncbi:MAG: hypothetical protein IKJ88_05510 [Clostridia bacterium]|nr:hypothetical protein [Clostridia bacterium]